MLLKQITFVANIVILSPVMAPKNLCAFTCLNQKTPLIAHEWRMPRYHEGLTKALKKISISDRYVIRLSFPFEVILKLYCLPNISSGRSRIQRYLQSDLKVSPKGFRFLCWFPFSDQWLDKSIKPYFSGYVTKKKLKETTWKIQEIPSC